MQIIRPTLGPGAYTVSRTTMRTPIDAHPSTRTSGGSSGAIDFSRMTPRRLQSYVGDMVRHGRMSVKDASALSGSIPREWYASRSDVPVDIASNIKNITASARGERSKPLAAFYEGLANRMKQMEAQGQPISVIA